MNALIRLTPDLTTKASATRRRFTGQLVDNLRRALAAEGLDAARVRSTRARLYLEAEDPRALLAVRRVFGVHSVSPCREVEVGDLDTLVRHGVELMMERVRGRTFAVRGRVRDRELGFRSQDVNEQLGAALVAVGRVDLERPDVTVHVEVRDGKAWFFERTVAGEGGLPLGVGGRAVVLLSGGFDSAVAGYLMMRRGVTPVFLCLRLGDEVHERATLAVANQLTAQWAPGLRLRLAMIPFEETVERLRRHVPPRYWQLVLKRLMYRTAEQAAARTGADAVVTGESLGQVSSQTLTNLRALDRQATLPVLRPLLTYDKDRIIELSRHIGTHDLSARVLEYCGLGARKPATAAKPHQLEEAEASMPFDAEAVLDAGRWFELPSSAEADGDVRTERIPTGAMVLDLRSPPERRRSAIPDAIALEPLDVLDRPESLDATRDYVVVCEQGARSAWFARRLRAMGFRAWSLERLETVVGRAGE